MPDYMLDYMTMLSFVRNCQTLFKSGSTILHSQQQYMRISVARRPHQQVVSGLWILAILKGLS